MKFTENGLLLVIKINFTDIRCIEIPHACAYVMLSFSSEYEIFLYCFYAE